MAFTPLMAEGFEQQGFERVDILGSGVVLSTVVRSGANGTRSAYCENLNSTEGRLYYEVFKWQGTAAMSAKGVSFWMRIDANQLGSSAYILKGLTGGGSQVWGFYLLNTGVLQFRDGLGSTRAITSGSIVDSTWHYYRIWFDENSTSGWFGVDAESVQANGNWNASSSGMERFRFEGGSVATTCYIDDIVVGDATSFSDIPVADIFAVTGGTSATTGGDALSSGTWQNTQEIPASDASLVTYTTNGTGDLYPDGSVFSLTNLSGAYTDVDDDPDSQPETPTDLWLTAPGNNNNTAAQASFGTPDAPPTVGAGLQTFKVWVRKTNHSTDCTAEVELWETGGGAALATVVASTTISSTTGQLLTGTWNASLLGTSNGSAVEIRVVGTVGGGNPSNRSSLEVGAIKWTVTKDSGTAKSGWIQTDTGSRAGPSGMTLPGSIAALNVFYRLQCGGSNREVSLVRGNSVDGVNLYTYSIINTAVNNVFNITGNTSIAPLKTEYARVGAGVTVNTNATLTCYEAIPMVVYAMPSAGGIIYNPIQRYMPHLVR